MGEPPLANTGKRVDACGMQHDARNEHYEHYPLHTATCEEVYGKPSLSISSVSCHILTAGGSLQMSKPQMQAIWDSKTIDDNAKTLFYNSNILQLYQMRKELDEILQLNVACARQLKIMQSPLHLMAENGFVPTPEDLIFRQQANNDAGIYFGYE